MVSTQSLPLRLRNTIYGLKMCQKRQGYIWAKHGRSWLLVVGCWLGVIVSACTPSSPEAGHCLSKQREGQWDRVYNSCNESITVSVCQTLVTGREDCETVAVQPNGFVYQIGNENSGVIVSLGSPVSVKTFACRQGYRPMLLRSKNLLVCEKQ